jgi:hypothetical protein
MPKQKTNHSPAAGSVGVGHNSNGLDRDRFKGHRFPH